MAQGDFRPMAQNREAMADLVAILDARRADYARAEAELDTSGDTIEESFAKLTQIASRYGSGATSMTLADQGFLELGAMRLEYRMIGPRPDAAPTIVMLHEGLGCVGLLGRFPGQAAGGDRRRRVRLFARRLRPVDRRSDAAAPAHLHARGGARGAAARCSTRSASAAGCLLGHSDGASIAAIYAGSVEDHRVRGLVLIAPHFFTEDMGIAEIARAKEAYATTDLRAEARALARRRRQRLPRLERRLARSRFPQVGHHRAARLYPRADPDRAGRERPVRHASRQIEVAQQECYCPVEVALLPGVRHSPHREAPEATARGRGGVRQPPAARAPRGRTADQPPASRTRAPKGE